VSPERMTALIESIALNESETSPSVSDMTRYGLRDQRRVQSLRKELKEFQTPTRRKETLMVGLGAINRREVHAWASLYRRGRQMAGLHYPWRGKGPPVDRTNR